MSRTVQEAAFWRSVALGLQYENQQLLNLISQMISGSHLKPERPEPSTQTQQSDIKHKENKKAGAKQKDLKCHKKGNSPVSEVSVATTQETKADDDELQAYLEFMRISEEHRKQRDANTKKNSGINFDSSSRRENIEDVDYSENAADNIVVDHEKLKREMRELYGADAVKIHCQETRVEMEFNVWRDKHRPVTWPALPLNIRI